MLEASQLREFGRRGYVVIPRVVSQSLIDTAMREIDHLLTEQPPPNQHQGQYFYWRGAGKIEPFLSLLLESPAFAIAQSLVEPEKLRVPNQAQIALNIPPFDHRPGKPHIDGLTPPEPSGRPGTFTMLAGILLTDQQFEDMGNLWVWPGTHLASKAYFREHGPAALLSCIPFPPVPLPAPEQVLGRAGRPARHNIGGNLSSTVRRVAYFRLQCQGHQERWRECVQDALLEFEPVRSALTIVQGP